MNISITYPRIQAPIVGNSAVATPVSLDRYVEPVGGPFIGFDHAALHSAEGFGGGVRSVSRLFRAPRANIVAKMMARIDRDDDFDGIVPYAKKALAGNRAAQNTLRLYIQTFSYLYGRDFERIDAFRTWSDPYERLVRVHSEDVIDSMPDEELESLCNVDPDGPALQELFRAWGEIARDDDAAYLILGRLTKVGHMLADAVFEHIKEAIGRSPAMESREIERLLANVERHRFDGLKKHADKAECFDPSSDFILSSFVREFSNRYRDDMSVLSAFAAWCLSCDDYLDAASSSELISQVMRILTFFNLEARINPAAYYVIDTLAGLNVDHAIAVLGGIPKDRRPEDHPPSVAQIKADRMMDGHADWLLQIFGESDAEQDIAHGFGPGDLDTAIDGMFSQMVENTEAWVKSISGDRMYGATFWPDGRVAYIMEKCGYREHPLHKEAMERLAHLAMTDLKALRLFIIVAINSTHAKRLMRMFDHQIIQSWLTSDPSVLYDIVTLAMIGSHSAGNVAQQVDIEPYLSDRELLEQLARSGNTSAQDALSAIDKVNVPDNVVKLY